MLPTRVFCIALSAALLTSPLPALASWLSQMPSATLQGQGQMTWLGFKLYNAKLGALLQLPPRSSIHTLANG